MVGRHLRQAGGRLAGRPVPAQARVGRDDVAGLDEAVVLGPFRHLAAAVGDEVVDVALVVGQEDEALEEVGVRAGVVVQPV